MSGEGKLSARIRALAEKASPGKWWLQEAEKRNQGYIRNTHDVGHVAVARVCTDRRWEEWRANAALISLLKTSLPEILAALEREEARTPKKRERCQILGRGDLAEFEVERQGRHYCGRHAELTRERESLDDDEIKPLYPEPTPTPDRALVEALQDVMRYDFSADEARLALMVGNGPGMVSTENGQHLQERCRRMAAAQERARAVLALQSARLATDQQGSQP